MEEDKSSFFACAQLCVCVSICLCPQESNLPKYTCCFGAKSLLHNVVYEGMRHRLISICHVQPVLPSACITNLLYTTTAIVLWKRRSSLIKYVIALWLVLKISDIGFVLTQSLPIGTCYILCPNSSPLC